MQRLSWPSYVSGAGDCVLSAFFRIVMRQWGASLWEWKVWSFVYRLLAVVMGDWRILGKEDVWTAPNGKGSFLFRDWFSCFTCMWPVAQRCPSMAGAQPRSALSRYQHPTVLLWLPIFWWSLPAFLGCFKLSELQRVSNIWPTSSSHCMLARKGNSEHDTTGWWYRLDAPLAAILFMFGTMPVYFEFRSVMTATNCLLQGVSGNGPSTSMALISNSSLVGKDSRCLIQVFFIFLRPNHGNCSLLCTKRLYLRANRVCHGAPHAGFRWVFS